MKFGKALVSLFACTLLASCTFQGATTPFPRAVTGPDFDQLRIRSASHWDLIAGNEAESIPASLSGNPRLFVKEALDKPTDFDEGFHNFLVSNLVQDGAAVYTEASEAQFEVSFSIQVVEHRKSFLEQKFRAGEISGWLIGGAFLEQAIDNWSVPERVLIPLGIAAEIYNAYWPDTYEDITEIIINSRVMDGTRVAVANSQVYYFNSQDMGNYRSGRTFPVVGSSF